MSSILKGIKSFFKFIYIFFKVLFKIFIYLLLSIRFIFKLFGDIAKNIGKQFKKLLRFSITFKITFFYGGIFSLLLIISSGAILLGFRTLLINQLIENINNEGSSIASYMNNHSSLNDLDYDLSLANDMVVIFNEGKKIIYKTEGIVDSPRFFQPTSVPLLESVFSNNEVIVNQEYTIKEEPYYIQIYKDISRENFYSEILLLILFVVNGLIIFLTLIFGSRISRKLLKPIDTMTDTVKAITIQDLDTRLDVGGSQDELKELAVTFNEMFDRIQSSYDKQNQFVSDASHELRTPIAVIQGYINLLDRWGKNNEDVLLESIDAIKGESENMKDLIEKLLFLARADRKAQNIQKCEFNVNELIDEVVKETCMIDSSHKIISYNKENLNYFGDRMALKQAIRIFVDNSIKFTPPDGEIRLSSFKINKSIAIEIKDSGIGIPAEDIPKIFDRFYRSDKSRTKETGGHGLGLSIAKLIIDNHQGYIEVKSKPNIGTKITILLPSMSKK